MPESKTTKYLGSVKTSHRHEYLAENVVKGRDLEIAREEALTVFKICQN